MSPRLFCKKITKTSQLLLGCFCFILSAQLSYAEVLSSEGYDSLLNQADKIRSAEPERFEELLATIAVQENKLTDNQKDHYNYLKQYQNAYLFKYEEAKQGLQEIIEKSKQPELVFRSRMLLVNIYSILREHSESFKNLQLLVEQLPTMEDDEIRQQGIMVAVFHYNSYKRYNLSKEYISKLEKEHLNNRNLCFTEQMNVEALYALGELTPTFSNLKDTISNCETIGENIAASVLKIMVAGHLLDTNDISNAHQFLETHLPKILETNYPRIISEYYILMGRASWELNNADAAEEYIKKGLEISEAETYIKPRVMAYSMLHHIKKSKGQYQEALHYFEKYSEADKAQINEVSAQQLAYSLVELQTAEKTQEIQLLNKQNEVLKLEQDLSQKEVANNRLILLLLLFVVATLAFWSYRIKQNQIEFKRRSETDDLTGVSSRHHFYKMCRHALLVAAERDMEVCFILFDMDRFKAVNDKYGHLVGDWVLQKSIEVSRPYWRQNDIVGRLGGEEFALMLPACNLNKAVEIAEKCRKAIEAVETSESGHKFHISASFGVTTSKISGYDFSKLIGDSDKIMYQAKAAGKNQVFQVANKS